MGVKGKCDGVAVVFFSVVNDLNMAVTTSVTINPGLIYKKGGRKRPPFRKTSLYHYSMSVLYR